MLKCEGSAQEAENESQSFPWVSKTNLLELLDGTLVDTAALVDQMTSGRRLARVDVAVVC